MSRQIYLLYKCIYLPMVSGCLFFFVYFVCLFVWGLFFVFALPLQQKPKTERNTTKYNRFNIILKISLED